MMHGQRNIKHYNVQATMTWALNVTLTPS